MVTSMHPLKVVMLGASLDQNGGIATVEKLILKHLYPGIEVQHITSHDEGSMRHRIGVFSKAVGRLLGKLIRQEVDIVHIHISDGGSLIRKALLSLVAFSFRKPVIMHAHGAEFHVTYAKLPNWLQQILARIFRQCQAFIVLSASWQDYYRSTLGLANSEIFVLPNPVELPAQLPARTGQRKIKILFCGRVGQRKGAFDLIQAFAKLPLEQQQGTELWLAGDGEIEQAQQLAQRLAVEAHLSFLGWVSAEQRDRLLAEADIFTLPSYNEGLPMALLEAMGWALPIVTTPVGGIPEVIISGENGFLVPPGAIEKLADSLNGLIADASLRLALGSAARKTVLPYDIQHYCRSLVDIYQRVTPSIRHSVRHSI